MDRRTFLGALGFSVLAAPLAAEAQQRTGGLEDGVLDGVDDPYVAKGKKVEHVARPRCARAGR